MKIIFLVVVLTIAYIYGMIQLEYHRMQLLHSLSTPSTQSSTSGRSSSLSLSVVLVEVTLSGAVATPKKVTVVPGSTLLDVLNLVGGATEQADYRCFDTNYIVQPGDSLYIPSTSSTPKISINKGSTGDLDSLPGIGYVMATRIIEYRTANGSFQTIEQLQNVSGIGQTTFNELKDLIML